MLFVFGLAENACLYLQNVHKLSVFSLASVYNVASNMENSAETAEMTKGIWFCIKALSTSQTTWDNNYDTMLTETKVVLWKCIYAMISILKNMHMLYFNTFLHIYEGKRLQNMNNYFVCVTEIQSVFMYAHMYVYDFIYL